MIYLPLKSIRDEDGGVVLTLKHKDAEDIVLSINKVFYLYIYLQI